MLDCPLPAGVEHRRRRYRNVDDRACRFASKVPAARHNVGKREPGADVGDQFLGFLTPPAQEHLLQPTEFLVGAAGIRIVKAGRYLSSESLKDKNCCVKAYQWVGIARLDFSQHSPIERTFIGRQCMQENLRASNASRVGLRGSGEWRG